MSPQDTPFSPPIPLVQRRSHIVGEVRGEQAGPTFLGVGCTHGNEPAGLMALMRVCEQLRSSAHLLRGRFVALRGNINASEKEQRFLSSDLNRIWTQTQIQQLQQHELDLTIPENIEQYELYYEFQELIDASEGEIFAMDLHTSSSHSAPFVVVAPRPANLHYASQLHAPLIFGLEELLAGTLMNHLCNLGHVTIGFEAGQHLDPQSVRCHEAAIWCTLEQAGMIQKEDFPDLDAHKMLLQQTSQGIPDALEVFYRHAITQEDAFRMEPGFANFDRVEKGQRIAADRNGPILALDDGYIFLPLYQGQGNDGFFLVRSTSHHPGLN
ncbi:MAG: succinylglutamate desuccinylase/aspartoacylase family protein [Myxococcales bacterium]|nr:succinylglutamate desuccinylase/aspartoacylase family protein [Myxococcales bacterium]